MTSNWVGRTVGSYRIESEIARGGVAIIYRARHLLSGRWVAIKSIQFGEGDETFLASFRREAKAIASLRHPNILTVFDYGEEEGLAYIVMEYVAGGSLGDLMTGEPFPSAEAAALVLPVARALAHAHKEGIVHCDVKPANILLPRIDWPLLTDFGLLRLLGSGSGASLPNMMSGTPGYLSPEQVIGEQLDQRSDIYSLGIILFELVTGQGPFQGDSPGDTMLKRLLEVPPLASERNDQVSPQMDRIIFKALSREPAGRFKAMAAMSKALSELANTIDLGDKNTGPRINFARETGSLAPQPHSERPHLLVVGTDAILPLPDEEVVLIGRADERPTRQPDLDLGRHGGFEAGVSRHHARIRQSDGDWLLEDLDSTNGTFVNSARVRHGEFARLTNGDVIHCGRIMLLFHEGEEGRL